MHCFYVVALFGLLGCVTAHKGGGGRGHGIGEFRYGQKGGKCYCDTSRRRSTCAAVTGSQVFGCPKTNSFRQCTGTTCAVQACPTGQVWSYKKNSCSACDVGQKLSTDSQTCVCNQGTTLNKSTGTCEPCPTGSTQDINRCYCPNTLARDIKNNACKACPADALIRKGRCVCTSTTLVFNQDTWTCSNCPGSWITPRKGKSYCTCTGVNQIFYERNASCYTCPAGTTASRNISRKSREISRCQCAGNTGLEFDYTSEKCICKAGYTLNASGVCTTADPGATPLNP